MILQLAWPSCDTGRTQRVHHCVIHHWKAVVFSILMIYVEPKSSDISTRMLNMVRFGLKLTKLQSEICFIQEYYVSVIVPNVALTYRVIKFYKS